MRRNRRLAVAGFTAAAVVAAVVVLTNTSASADVSGPTLATTSNGSDPNIIQCVDSQGGNVAGYCLYTSQDLGQSSAYPPANVYPMNQTRVYFSTNGYSGWTAKGVVFNESAIDTSHGGFVPVNAKHLWAPSVARISNTNTYYLYVPDVSNIGDTGTPSIHDSSRIAVAVSTTGPFGPFAYIGTVPFTSGYMSDPDVMLETGTGGSVTRHLVWADGDGKTCGGLKYARLDADMVSLVANTTTSLTINGLSVLGNCGGKGRPYLEGASLYKWNAFDDDAYTLIFAAKPTSVPNECTTTNAGSGASNTANEVIAWATSFSPSGPWTYRGIFMCGSTTEWTNQATVTVTSNGKRIMIYHDGPAAPNRQRKLHAECIFSGSIYTVGAFRQALDAANGFNDCVAGTNVSYVALYAQQSTWPPLVSTTKGTGDLKAARFVAGPWERYRVEVLDSVTHTVAIRALSNGNLICSSGPTVPLAPTCTSTSDLTARFIQETASGSGARGAFELRSVANNNYVRINGDGKLTVDAATKGDSVSFYTLTAGA